MTRARLSSMKVDIAAIAVSASVMVAGLRGGMPGDRVNPAAPGTGVTDLVGVPLAVLLALGAGLLLLRGYRRPTVFALIAVVPLLAVLSLTQSRYEWASLTACTVLAGAFAAGAGAAAVTRNVRGSSVVAGALVVVPAIVAALGIREYAGQVAQHNLTWRVFSTFATPNFLAGYLCMAVPVAAAMMLAAADRLVALLAGFALVLEVAALLLTGSRFGLVCLVVALAVFGAFALKAGALTGPTRLRALSLVAAGVLASAAGIRPVLHRLGNVGLESYSTQFREYTWRGALRMAVANPILGTGIGTFDTAYPRYALVSYTEHAHNSYLQIADEIGIPAALLFAGWMAMAVASTVRARWRPWDADPPREPGGTKSKQRNRGSGQEALGTSAGRSIPVDFEMLKAGVLGAVAGALLRNTFDSDLYVPANAFAFAVLCGLMAGFAARGPEAAASRGWRSAELLRWSAGLAGAAAGILCIMIAAGRVQALLGTKALVGGDALLALQRLRAASGWDPLNPNYRLAEAQVLEGLGDTASAGREYQAAVRLADIGKCHYRYARFLEGMHDLNGAIREFERARSLEPLNLQNLLALAEAYEAANRPGDALMVYQRMADLYHEPVGRVRALPELVNWEFGAAYAALGRHYARIGALEQAEANYRQAVDIFREYWDRRTLQIVQVEVRPGVLRSVAERYRAALAGWEQTLRALGRSAAASEASGLRKRLEKDLAGMDVSQ